MNRPCRAPGLASDTWYSHADRRRHDAWGRDTALELIERCAQVGWWTLVLPARKWTWSDGMYRLHGYEPREVALPPGAAAILDRVRPEERERAGAVLSVFDEARSVREEEVGLEYWARTGQAIPRRIRLHGRLEAASGTGRISWIGCAQDVTDTYLSTRALSALTAAEEALSHWRSFSPSLEQLLRLLAPVLDSSLAMAWIRGPSGRLEPRVTWRAPDLDRGVGEDPTAAGNHRSLARTVWATRDAFVHGSGLGVPAIWNGQTVAALTFESSSAYLDEELAASLRWLGAALGRRLTGDRPEMGEARLSDREREVLQLAADGYDGPAIAQHLFVSPATVKTHFLHVYEKLGVGDRAAAVARALRQGLIS